MSTQRVPLPDTVDSFLRQLRESGATGAALSCDGQSFCARSDTSQSPVLQSSEQVQHLITEFVACAKMDVQAAVPQDGGFGHLQDGKYLSVSATAVPVDRYRKGELAFKFAVLPLPPVLAARQ